MSYTFLAAAGVESSAECFSDIPASVLSRLTIIAEKCCSKDSEMEHSHSSLSGMTYAPLTVTHGVVELMSYAPASPARKSAPLDSAEDSWTRTITEPSSESFAKLGRDLSSWKIPRYLLAGDLADYSEKWPAWGMMRDGECWELATPGFLTDATASGASLPTPSGVNGGNNHTMGRIDEWGGRDNPLRGTLIGSMCLPEFEELVIGWPITWTALTPLEMDKLHEWLRSHGEF